MKKLVITQSVACLAVCLTAAFWGMESAFSALLGGIAYLLPTLLASAVMYLTGKNAALSLIGFFWAEGMKVMLALLMMVAAFVLYPSLQWLPFLAALLIVSFSVFFVIGKMSHYGNGTERECSGRIH